MGAGPERYPHAVARPEEVLLVMIGHRLRDPRRARRMTDEHRIVVVMFVRIPGRQRLGRAFKLAVFDGEAQRRALAQVGADPVVMAGVAQKAYRPGPLD